MRYVNITLFPELFGVGRVTAGMSGGGKRFKRREAPLTMKQT